MGFLKKKFNWTKSSLSQSQTMFTLSFILKKIFHFLFVLFLSKKKKKNCTQISISLPVSYSSTLVSFYNLPTSSNKPVGRGGVNGQRSIPTRRTENKMIHHFLFPCDPLMTLVAKTFRINFYFGFQKSLH